MSIFTQVWLWSVAAFAIGAVLAVVLLVLPARKQVKELQRRLTAAETARPEPATRQFEPDSPQETPKPETAHFPVPVPEPTRAFEPAPEPDPVPDYTRDPAEYDAELTQTFARAEFDERRFDEPRFDPEPEPLPYEHTTAYQPVYREPEPVESTIDIQPHHAEPAPYELSEPELFEPAVSEKDSVVEKDSGAHRREDEPSSVDFPAYLERQEQLEPVESVEQSWFNRSAVAESAFEESAVDDTQYFQGRGLLDEPLPESLPEPLPEPEPRPEPEPVFETEPMRGPSLFTPQLDDNDPYPYGSSVDTRTEDDVEAEALDQTQVLPKRQPRESPPGGFDPPQPIQPSMRQVERREPAPENVHSGSLFEPAVPAPHAGAMLVPDAPPPPPAREVVDSSVPIGPFGPGSAMPKPGGGRPAEEFTVKASVTALRYVDEDSPQFPKMVAEVWFRSPADAERVGFRPLA